MRASTGGNAGGERARRVGASAGAANDRHDGRCRGNRERRGAQRAPSRVARASAASRVQRAATPLPSAITLNAIESAVARAARARARASAQRSAATAAIARDRVRDDDARALAAPGDCARRRRVDGVSRDADARSTLPPAWRARPRARSPHAPGRGADDRRRQPDCVRQAGRRPRTRCRSPARRPAPRARRSPDARAAASAISFCQRCQMPPSAPSRQMRKDRPGDARRRAASSRGPACARCATNHASGRAAAEREAVAGEVAIERRDERARLRRRRDRRRACEQDDVVAAGDERHRIGAQHVGVAGVEARAERSERRDRRVAAAQSERVERARLRSPRDLDVAAVGASCASAASDGAAASAAAPACASKPGDDEGQLHRHAIIVASVLRAAAAYRIRDSRASLVDSPTLTGLDRVALRTGRRPALHARPQGLGPQRVHLVHLADLDGRHRARRRGADRRAVGDERLPAGAAQPHPVASRRTSRSAASRSSKDPAARRERRAGRIRTSSATAPYVIGQAMLAAGDVNRGALHPRHRSGAGGHGRRHRQAHARAARSRR